MTHLLPLADEPAPERADAARNREAILAAALRLVRTRGVGCVTMDTVAAEAGVGKGTLYRRFSDKGGLAGALLSARGTELQQQILAGDPPLGPGAPPAERLVAFTRAYLSFQVRHLDLVLLSETSTPGGRLRKAAYVFWRQHLRMLLSQSGAPDPLTRAEVLLAGLSAEQVEYWLRDQERPSEQLATSLAALAAALARPLRP